MQPQQIQLHITSYKENNHQLLLYATVQKNGEAVPLDADWAEWAFLWHESSYYGMHLEKKIINGQLYIPLTHHQAYEFFVKLPFNPWFSFDFGPSCAQYLADSKEIAEQIQADAIEPYLTDTPKGGQIFSWGTEADEYPKWADWFGKIILSAGLARKDSYTDMGLKKYTETYMLYSLYKMQQEQNGGQGLNEEAFYKQIGWKPKNRSYALALQLLEPETENETLWTLQAVIRPAAQTDAVWLPYRPNQSTLGLEAGAHKSIVKRLFVWQQHTPFIGSGQTDSDRLPVGRSLSDQEAYIFLMEIAPDLVRRHITVLLPIWWKDIQKKKWTVQATVGTQTSEGSVMPLVWQDFDWRLAVGDAQISEAEFIQALHAGRHLIRMGNEWMLLDEKALQEIQAYIKTAEKKGFQLRDMMMQEGRRQKEADTEAVPEAEADEPFHVEIKAAPLWHAAFRELFDPSSEKEICLGTDFCGHLRDYQQTAVNWLGDRCRRRLGTILADDMGLGKTVMVIGYLIYIRKQTAQLSHEADAPILLICPTSLLGSWETELQKFAPHLKILMHYGSTREKSSDSFAQKISAADVVLTTYGLISNDFELLRPFTWQSIVLDEAQNIKNHAAKQSRSIRSLTALHRVALTGTPVENRLTDLWTLFDFIQPNYLGSLKSFKQEYIAPIEAEQNERKRQALKVLIQPFFMRRTKTEPHIRLNLPDKLEQKSFLHLNTEQTVLYHQLVEICKANRQADNSPKQRGMILAALNHLKMICDHPALYLHETKNNRWLERSPKLAHCMELLENIFAQQEQVLIFTQYIEMAKIIQFAVKKTFGTDAPFFHGGLGKAARDQLVADFQSGVYPLLILSLKAGGTGLTLTRANHVIHFDRWWNPAVENQATDRVHRIGQENFVHVHKLITKGTLEEKIDALMDKKLDLSEQILSPENWLSQMSFDEFLRMVL